MRISDWSSDVCSSDLAIANRAGRFFYLSDIGLQGGTNTTTNGYRWGTNFMNAYSGYYINRYANADITWEVSEKYNLGIEIGLFNAALKIQGDFFRDIRRAEDSRVGKECVIPCRYRWAHKHPEKKHTQNHIKKQNNQY